MQAPPRSNKCHVLLLLCAALVFHLFVLALMFRLYFHTGTWVPVLPLAPPRVLAPLASQHYQAPLHIPSSAPPQLQPSTLRTTTGAVLGAAPIPSATDRTLSSLSAETLTPVSHAHAHATPRPPHSSSKPPPGAFPALSKRVILFVVDGLSLEGALHDDNHLLRRIIGHDGVWGVCYARAPTESIVGHGTILTGALLEPFATLPWRGERACF